MTERLPAKVQDHVVEISLGHVVLAFATLAGTAMVTGLVIVMARDYARYRRQRAILESATGILKTLTDRTTGGEACVETVLPDQKAISQKSHN